MTCLVCNDQGTYPIINSKGSHRGDSRHGEGIPDADPKRLIAVRRV
jgi:hypothetical protein